MNDNYIKSISINHFELEDYLSELVGLKKFQNIIFDSPITFFVGENGSGKSTLLEAIAVHMGFNAEGGSKNFNFTTYDSHSDLYQSIKTVRHALKPEDGFFLRSESFYNVATYVEQLDLNLKEYGGVPIHEQSRGEGIFNLINNRFRGNGIYLLDEPEAGLSQSRQLALLAGIHQLALQGSQFIIATHSPILLAHPDAKIISFDEDQPPIVTYEETKAYEIMSLFMSRRERMIEELLS